MFVFIRFKCTIPYGLFNQTATGAVNVKCKYILFRLQCVIQLFIAVYRNWFNFFSQRFQGFSQLAFVPTRQPDDDYAHLFNHT